MNILTIISNIYLLSIGVALCNVLPSAEGPIYGRIHGGKPVAIESVPYQASLRDPYGKHCCGGSVISQKYILTSAHCVVDKGFSSVRVGTDSINDGGTDYRIRNIESHKDFSNKHLDCDVAVVEIDGIIQMSNKVQPVKLIKYDFEVPDRTVLTVTGWGQTEHVTSSKNLLRVEIPKVSNENCSKFNAEIGVPVTENMLCAGDIGIGSCHGDSGGPLTMKTEQGVIQVGIVSWVRPVVCSQYGNPSVFASVAALRDWISIKTGV